MPFQCKDPNDRQRIGSMRLQTYARTSYDEVSLVNLSIDASSFLLRRDIQLNDYPKCIIGFIRQMPLNPNNTIEMVDDEPVVTINREKMFT